MRRFLTWRGLPCAARITEAINQLRQDIQTMSETLSAKIDAATTELQADLASLTVGVTKLETDLATALAGVTPGATITQGQVDALTAIHTSLSSLAASIPTGVPPVA